MDICKPCLLYFGCRKHFSHEITFRFTILQQKGIGNTLVMRFCLLSFGNNPSEASFKPLQYVTMGAMGLS